MDLSTLDNLLKNHITHIQRLYSRLGAQEGVVTEKVQQLHAALIATVDQQRQAAEAEVKQAEVCVADLKETIIVKRRRLGHDAGSDGAVTKSSVSASSLLDQQAALQQENAVLTSEVQLRTERISGLQKDIASFEESLDSEYMRELQHQGADIKSAADDLSQRVIASLESMLDRCRQEQTRREQALLTILYELLELWTDLGIKPNLRDGHQCLVSITDATTAQDIDDAAAIWLARLQKEASPVTGCENLPTSAQWLEALAGRQRELELERDLRTQRIQELYDQIYPLWTRLGISEEESDDFIETWKGCETRCIVAYEKELAKMLQIKADNMAIFVQNERQEIQRLWDELLYGDEERAVFLARNTELSDEAALEACEEEKARLVQEQRSKDGILKKLSKYFALLDELRQLEESANDPSRLTSKGQRGDPGRLLREEKQRKRVSREKPRLEKDLLQEVPLWEEQNQSHFLVNGVRLLEELASRLQFECDSRPPSRRAKTAAPQTVAKADSNAVGSIKRPPSAVPRHESTTKRLKQGVNFGTAYQDRNQSARHAAVSSHVLATPCPPSQSTSSQHKSGLMLTSSGPSASTSTSAMRGLVVASRLPLKATLPGYINIPCSSSRLPRSADIPTGGCSLFSPDRGSSVRQSAAFKPRPSVASTATSTSTVSSVFSGSRSRVTSAATSIASGKQF